MKMTMNSQFYRERLALLHPSLIDMLRKVAVWVDESKRDTAQKTIQFHESVFQDQSGILGAIFGEQTGEVDLKGAKELAHHLKTDWQIFTQLQPAILEVHDDNYMVFRKELEKALANQPLGFDKTLPLVTINAQARVKTRNSEVCLEFAGEEICIAESHNKMGKLLVILGTPELGLRRKTNEVIKSLLNTATPISNDEAQTIIRNLIKEIQRKISEANKAYKLRAKFEGNLVWLETI